LVGRQPLPSATFLVLTFFLSSSSCSRIGASYIGHPRSPPPPQKKKPKKKIRSRNLKIDRICGRIVFLFVNFVSSTEKQERKETVSVCVCVYPAASNSFLIFGFFWVFVFLFFGFVVCLLKVKLPAEPA
jgi:hypothetical protein